jgi:hypothetical protein
LWEEEYKAKYVSWTGKVGFKGGAIYDWNKVLNLKVEDVVTYTGRLISLRGLLTPYRLDDGDFFQVR